MPRTQRRFARLLIVAALLGGAIMSGIHPALVGATTFTANVFTDPPPGTCATTGTGNCSLREATIYANAHPGTAITLLPGVYTLTIPPASPNDATTGSLKITANTTMTVAGGAATIDGGGTDRVLSTGSGITVSITDVTFRNGNAASGNGGGILNPATLTLSRCVVTGNHAAGGGGGIATDSGTLTLSNGSVVSGNTAAGSGGGIYGSVTMTDSTISGNTAAIGGGMDGGGIISGSTISGNTATTIGGGLYTSNFGGYTITNSTISGNSSPTAGAIYLTGDLNGDDLTNVTIVGNSSGVASSAFHGGIFLRNSLLANTGPNCSGDVFSRDYNLSSDASCSPAQPHDRQGIDPMVGPLADNGGPTRTHALLPGSPAIDAGSCILSDGMTPITADQRGIARPQGGACDIGAYEVAVVLAAPTPRPGPSPVGNPPPAPTPRSTVPPTAGPLPSPRSQPPQQPSPQPTPAPLPPRR